MIVRFFLAALACAVLLSFCLLLPKTVDFLLSVVSLGVAVAVLSMPYSSKEAAFASVTGTIAGGILLAFTLQIIDHVLSHPTVAFSDAEILLIGARRLLDLEMREFMLYMAAKTSTGLLLGIFLRLRLMTALPRVDVERSVKR